jgi:hypothetical protein
MEYMTISTGDDYQSGRMLRAYHEAGYAVVGHVIGRCITEVSISMEYDGYAGYCPFNPLIEDANDHPEWRDDLGNPDLVTIYYAGMLAMAYSCAPYVTFYEDESCVEYPEGSERDDLVQIQKILAQIRAEEQQRTTITDASWIQAQRSFRCIGLLWTRWLRLCWLLRISVPKMRVIDVSTRSLLMPSPYQAAGKKVSQTLLLS